MNALAAASNTNCSGPLSIPTGFAPGTYYVGAYADDQLQVDESDENNNTLIASNTMTVFGNSHHMPPGSPHDGIEPMRRSVRRVIDMRPADHEAALSIAAE